MHSKLMSGLCALALPCAALAGGTAQMHAEGDGKTANIKFEYLDADTVRLESEEQQGAYIVVLDGKPYSVMNGDDGPTVIDMQAMMSKMGGMMKRRQPDNQRFAAAKDIEEVVSMTDTGRNETVAGYEGDVYDIVYKDKDGAEHTKEAVLSKDAAVRELTEAMLGLGQAMSTLQEGSTNSGAALRAKLDEMDVGLLRVADNWSLESLSSAAPDAAQFELPAEPQDMPSFGDMRQMREMRDRMRDSN